MEQNIQHITVGLVKVTLFKLILLTGSLDGSNIMNSFLRLPSVIGTEFSNVTTLMRDRFQNVSDQLAVKFDNLHMKLTEDVLQALHDNENSEQEEPL